jgi:hypothetical protein
MMPGTAADASRTVDRRMALAKEWDDLVEQIRRLDGFEDFLKPPPLERLLPAAEAGPVVIVNVSRWRSDALIVTTNGVEVKTLPGLTAEATSLQARAYLDRLHEVEAAAEHVHQARKRADGVGRPLEEMQSLRQAVVGCEASLRDVTEWLWDQIAGPVLAVLGVTGPPAPGQPWPRLWLCPTGLLSLLPLHAAGHHSPEGRAHHESTLDRVVSSYTPTLRALLEARGRGTAPSRSFDDRAHPHSAAPHLERMLVVALASTPGRTPLPNVFRERELLTTLFSGNNTVLDSSEATWEAVRAQLPQHGWVHFSCHGDQNLAEPSRGGILLHDRLLTIEEISKGRYHGDFAFLSACKTATGGITLPDEAITLAAALHYTGYRHVIGTMWSIQDETAADVAEAVYTELTSAGRFEPDRAAIALHLAIRGLRNAGKPLSQWMPFTHTGP